MEHLDLTPGEAYTLGKPDQDFVFAREMLLEEARTVAGGDLDDLAALIDEAQGHVHMGKSRAAYVVIKISA